MVNAVSPVPVLTTTVSKMSVCSFQTPPRQSLLSAELRSIINERNVLTTKTRMKVLSALDDVSRNSSKIKNEEKQRQLRSDAVQEILTSEASYLHQLETIMKYFMEPLKTKPFVSQAEWTALFGNIDTLYKVNGALLEELKDNPENVAAAFLKLAPYFKLYSVYAYDYKHIVYILQEMHRNNGRLAAFVMEQEMHPEVSRKLASLLIVPIQRIPRYRLLLREVLSHTTPFQQDYYTLQNALQEVEKTAEHINGLVHEQENMEKMIKLQSSLQYGRPGIVTPGRKLIKEGILMKVSSNGRRPLPRYFILFSDMIIYCVVRAGKVPSQAGALRCCCVLPLKRCIVEPVLSQGVLRLTCHGETLILYSTCVDDTKRWLQALQQAVKQYHANLQTLRKESSSRRPLRVKDLNGSEPSISSQALVKRSRKRRHPENEERFSPVAPLKSSTPVETCSPDTPDQRHHLMKNCLRDCRPNKLRRMLVPHVKLSPAVGLRSSYPLKSSLRTSNSKSGPGGHRVKIITPSTSDSSHIKTLKDSALQLVTSSPNRSSLTGVASGSVLSQTVKESSLTCPLTSETGGSLSGDSGAVIGWSPFSSVHRISDIFLSVHKAVRRSLRRSLFRFTPELQLQ